MPPSIHTFFQDTQNGFIYHKGFWFALHHGDVYRVEVKDGAMCRFGLPLALSADGKDHILNRNVLRDWVTRNNK